jgi:uncharacterized protein DUF1573
MNAHRARTTILLGAILLLVTACGGEDSEAPHLVVDDPVADFGPLFAEESRRHIFRLRNDGKSLLKIHRVKKDCGCTQPELSRAEIPPGETATLSVDFRPPVLGTVAKRIWVYSNDPRGELIIRLRAEGQGIARVRPRVIRVPEIYELHPDGKIPVEIEVAEGRKLAAVTIASQRPGLQFRSEAPPQGRRGRYLLELPRFREPTSLRESIPIFVTHADDPNPKRLALPLQIIGRASPRRWVEPAALHLGAAAPGAELEFDLRLHGASTSPSGLRPRFVGVEETEVEFFEVDEGFWRMRVRFPKRPGRVTGRIAWTTEASSSTPSPAATDGWPEVPVHGWCLSS